MKRKLINAVLIALALAVLIFNVGLADSNCPPTDVPPPPPTETSLPPPPPPTETRLPPPTETSEPTPTSPPPATETQLPPTETSEVPFSEPTPTIEVDPTPTETLRPGVTPTREKHSKPTATWDCIKYPDNPEKCLAHTGGGLPANISLGLIGIGMMVCILVIVLARKGRHA